MNYYEDYGDEPYYEPTPADEIFIEAKIKLEECLKESIKYKMKSLSEENIKLKQENEKAREKVRNIEWREQALENKEKNIERNALQKTFSEMLKPLEEKITIYNVDYEYVYVDKCDQCNDKRKIEFTSPTGKIYYEDCKCNKSHRVFVPIKRCLKTLSLYKKRDYPYTVSVTPKYDSPSYDDTYCKFELNVYIENLDDTENSYNIEELNYKEVGFKLKKDCQKLCDYLNENEKIPKEISKKAKGKKATDEDDWDLD